MAKPPLQTVAWLCRPAEMWRRGSSKGPPGPPESRSHTRTSIVQRHMMSRCSVSDAVVVVGLCLCERVKSRSVKSVKCVRVAVATPETRWGFGGIFTCVHFRTKGTFGTMQKVPTVGIRDLTRCKHPDFRTRVPGASGGAGLRRCPRGARKGTDDDRPFILTWGQGA
jgi:hypothetical protein